MKTRTIIFIVLAAVLLPALIIIIAAISILVATKPSDKPTDKNNNSITNFEQCVDAGNPVTLSFPGTCTTQDGKSFTDPSQTVK